LKKGELDVMFNLANYYDVIEKNYDKMKKYYLMVIKKD
jgi:hypothetical protein